MYRDGEGGISKNPIKAEACFKESKNPSISF